MSEPAPTTKPGNNDDDIAKLGSCCICEREDGVTTIVMLSVKGPVRGRGWGCVVCNLPMDGASAVLCESCLPDYAAERTPLRFACAGYPATDGRVAVDTLTKPHEHDLEIDHG